MNVIELNREEYLESVKKIEDFKTLNFSKSALEWWDNYYSWEKFPPLCLSDKKKHFCYLFYNISKDNEYLTIHNIFTPNKYRAKGYAYQLLEYLFSHFSNQNIKRFKLNCVSSSLDFYNKLGLEYWGINELSQYYCDFKMPLLDIKEIPLIVKNSHLDEISDERILKIFDSLKDNGTTLDEKMSEKFEELKDKLKGRYHFDLLLKRVEKIKNDI
ncbi:MAG: GNAT family N-acetyltransferase [Arcobacter sp.]|uniref:GNAT family N-acetyltransferase n=1 Tax=Arcobacter sp. TaxID=1872629 RepID=UPI003D0704A5